MLTGLPSIPVAGTDHESCAGPVTLPVGGGGVVGGGVVGGGVVGGGVVGGGEVDALLPKMSLSRR